MTINNIPVKTKVMVLLSIGEADCKGLSELLNIPTKNLRQRLYEYEQQGVITRVNDGERPLTYKRA